MALLLLQDEPLPLHLDLLLTLLLFQSQDLFPLLTHAHVPLLQKLVVPVIDHRTLHFVLTHHLVNAPILVPGVEEYSFQPFLVVVHPESSDQLVVLVFLELNLTGESMQLDLENELFLQTVLNAVFLLVISRGDIEVHLGDVGLVDVLRSVRSPVPEV